VFPGHFFPPRGPLAANVCPHNSLSIIFLKILKISLFLIFDPLSNKKLSFYVFDVSQISGFAGACPPSGKFPWCFPVKFSQDMASARENGKSRLTFFTRIFEKF